MNRAHYQRLFNKHISQYHLFGVEKEFHDLGKMRGLPVPDWLKGETLYEIYVRAFSEEGTFEGVRKNIRRITGLGIKVVWFMPVYPIGLEQRKGSAGCPYAIRDYFTVNPEYGSEEDFRRLVSELHANGIKVLIDMVANHVAPDYKPLKDIFGLIQRDPVGRPVRAVADWEDIADLDYSNPQTRMHMMEILQYWVREFDIDGYRCDVAGMVPLHFWEEAVPKLIKLKPDFYMLAEWESPLLQQRTFHSTYDWILYCILTDLVTGKIGIGSLVEWLSVKKETYPKNSLFLRFLENHDKVRAVSVFKGRRIYPYLVLLFALDGLPLIYNGQEASDPRYLSLFDKQAIEWDSAEPELYKAYKSLIALRQNYESLYSKEIEFLDYNSGGKILGFIKGANERLLVLINFSESDAVHSIFERIDIKKHNLVYNTHSVFQAKELLPLQAIIVKI